VPPTTLAQLDGGSFRDPSGFVFYLDGEIYRQINLPYKKNYDQIMDSGLYRSLVEAEHLIPHQESNILPVRPEGAYKIIKPAPVEFISYPYEWCFSELKAAALTTLKIQRMALDHGMSLKDCSAYNIQFRGTHPVLIDSLSFEEYQRGRPWVAYKQFCQHFLAPLALMSYRGPDLGRLSQLYIDGVPLALAKSLLSLRSYLHWAIFFHIALHASAQRAVGGGMSRRTARNGQFNARAFQGLLDSLERGIESLKLRADLSTWSAYHEGEAHYGTAGLEHKKKIVAAFLERCKTGVLWDIGANQGSYGQMAAEKGFRVITFDRDPLCVELGYRQAVERRLDILSLVMDIAAPSPGIGWQLQERKSLLQRRGADTILALALIHHLAISNNLPLTRLAEFFASIGERLIIEFVAKEDPKVQVLVANREDVFSDYTRANFEGEFGRRFVIEAAEAIPSSQRVLYLMRRRSQDGG
jgi:hypothetical protein